MLTVREARTDADLEAWRGVRMAVRPGERAATVAEMRDMQAPGRTLLLAELDGVVAGHGLADRSQKPGRGFVMPRVVPTHRRRGVGTALLDELVRLALADGQTVVSSGVEDEDESLAFARRFGFVETDREVQQLRRIGVEAHPPAPDGWQIVSLSERPDLAKVAYRDIGIDGVADMALASAIEVSPDEWERDWLGTPEATFFAIADGHVVGLSSLTLDPDHPERAEQRFTTVRRDWRGHHVASTLKRMVLWWAAEHGLSELYTWTQRHNDDMRRVNEHLGFTYGQISITLEAPLPLTVVA